MSRLNYMVSAVKFFVHYLFFGTSKVIFEQVHYIYTLWTSTLGPFTCPSVKLSNFAVSTPLLHRVVFIFMGTWGPNVFG